MVVGSIDESRDMFRNRELETSCEVSRILVGEC